MPARDAVIPKLVRALKPGGWLVVEEYDLFPARASPDRAWAATTEAAIAALRAGGSDYAWARGLPPALAAAGLEITEAAVDAPYFRGGSTTAAFHWLTGEQGRPQLTAAPPEVRDGFEAAQAALRDPEAWFLPPAMIAVSGRGPGGRLTAPTRPQAAPAQPSATASALNRSRQNGQVDSTSSATASRLCSMVPWRTRALGDDEGRHTRRAILEVEARDRGAVEARRRSVPGSTQDACCAGSVTHAKAVAASASTVLLTLT